MELKKNKGLKKEDKVLIKTGKTFDGKSRDKNENDRKEGQSTSGFKSFLKLFTMIRAKLIMAFLVPVVFIVALGVISYSKSSKGLIGNYESSTLSNMFNMAKYLDFGFGVVSSKANILNGDRSLQDYYSGTYKNDKFEESTHFQQVQTLINTNILSEKYISDIFVLANYGSSISSNGTLSSRLVYQDFIDKGEGAYLNDGQKEVWVGTHTYLDTQSAATNASYAVSYIRYLYNNARMPVGSIVLDVSANFVTDVLTGSGLPDGSVITFITNDGREIINGSIPDNFKFTEQKYYKEAVENKDQNSGLEYVKFNNGNYLFVYSRIATSNSLLCAVIPKSYIVKQANEVKNITLMAVLITVILAVAFGTFLASGFSITIHRVIKVLQKAGSGDLTDLTRIKRKDEFRILGSSINDMIGSMLKLIRKMMGISTTVSQSAATVSESSNNLVSATQNISLAVGDIEQGVTQQAVDSESCLHRMADLAEKINAVYDSTHNIERIANNTKNIVSSGLGIVDNLSSKTKDTSDITHSVIQDIEGLEKESSAIISIIATMNEIAEQTNLLSLNASIEAARGGQAGRGFAVVADEIRKLADRSVKASNEIGSIIHRIEDQTKKTANTARYAESIVMSQEGALTATVNAFSDINGHVENLTENLKQIANGVEGIEKAKNETLGAIENISATSEETAAAAEQLSVTADRQLEEVRRLNEVVQQLSGDANNLQETVSVFKIS
jgi:methyl-accepting chemotaxis protein